MKQTRWLFCCWLGLSSWLFGSMPLSTAAEPPPVHYLYINANEDLATGGHVALKVGRHVYHYQFQDGQLRLFKDKWAHFQFSYRGLQNRSLNAYPLELSADVSQKISDAFSREWLIQLFLDKRLNAIRQNAEFAQRDKVVVAGAGGFSQQPLTGKLLSAWRHVGKDLTSQRSLSDQEAHLNALSPKVLRASEDNFREGRLPFPSTPFFQEWSQARTNLFALQWLNRPTQIKSALFLDPQLPELTLTPEERHKLQADLSQLEQRLIRLASEQPPNWGEVFLLGIARWQIGQLSLIHNRWLLLDGLSETTRRYQASDRAQAAMPDITANAWQNWQKQRRLWQASDQWDELRWHEMENALARWHDIQHANRHETPIRIRENKHPLRLVGEVENTAQQRLNAKSREAFVQAKSEAEAIADKRVSYHLIERNCVTELFEVLFQASGLPRFKVNPVPFLSAQQVAEHWPTQVSVSLDSYRQLAKQAKAEQGANLAEQFQEQLTLSSSFYQPADEDSSFLVFTDDLALSRPVAGAANILWGVGASAWGLVNLPLDQGETLTRGAKGVFWSLPELLFFNIRKGNTLVAPEPPEDRQRL